MPALRFFGRTRGNGGASCGAFFTLLVIVLRAMPVARMMLCSELFYNRYLGILPSFFHRRYGLCAEDAHWRTWRNNAASRPSFKLHPLPLIIGRLMTFFVIKSRNIFTLQTITGLNLLCLS